MQKRPFRKVASFEERLAAETQRLKTQAKASPPGTQREGLLRKARQAETASHISQWLNSPGLASPK
jgi:hypothetical protein